jgi:hypothetical protein
MRPTLLSIFLFFCLSSCKDKESPTDYALKWTTEIKSKILEDVSVIGDSVSIDTSNTDFKEVTIFSNGVRTKFFGIWTAKKDTGLSVFYSKDQNFELVRELCPGTDGSFEGIRYNGVHMGLSEFRFCNGNLESQGYRFGGNVGVWKEWNEKGDLIKESDIGNTEKLNELKKIKYYR